MLGAAATTISAQDCGAFLSANYVIIYRVDGQDVLILHVIRGSRDIDALLDARL